MNSCAAFSGFVRHSLTSSAPGEPESLNSELAQRGTRRINAAGARALLGGDRAGSLPALTLDTFRGAATGLQNYVAGQDSSALDSAGTDDGRYADRSVRHLLTHLASAESYERVLDAALAEADLRPFGRGVH
jgi:hypothetical protein